MGQLKKRGYKGLASGGGAGNGDEPPLNNPFLAAKQQLQATVKPKPEPPKAEQKPWLKKAGPKPPPSEPKEERLSDEEMFRQEMFGVSRLGAAQGRARPIEQEREVVLRQTEEAEAYAQLSDLVEGVGPFDISDSDEYIEGIAPGLDKRLLSRLRRGDYAVQGHVDLHGMTREEARIRVEQFVAESITRGHRCVLIVHGRGLNSKDQIPVLKEAVRLWLVRGRIARSVLCFATARPTDGGAGAVYVLLRR
jgi:DNA-nicking Smr family endonuclease